MANFLERFNKIKTPGMDFNDGEIYDFTDEISPSGDFTKIKNIDVIINSWYCILMTPRRSYIDDPEFGCDLYKYVFEPADVDTIESIQNEIQSSIARYEERAYLSNIDVLFLQNRKGFMVNILVEFNGLKKNLQFVVDQNIYNQFINLGY